MLILTAGWGTEHESVWHVAPSVSIPVTQQIKSTFKEIFYKILSLRLNFRFILLVGIQASNHVTHSLCVQMRQWHSRQNNITPVITWPVKISVIVSIAVRIQTIAVIVCLMLKWLWLRLRLWLLLDGVIKFMFFGRTSEVQFVFFDGRMGVDCPRDVVSVGGHENVIKVRNKLN